MLCKCIQSFKQFYKKEKYLFKIWYLYLIMINNGSTNYRFKNNINWKVYEVSMLGNIVHQPNEINRVRLLTYKILRNLDSFAKYFDFQFVFVFLFAAVLTTMAWRVCRKTFLPTHPTCFACEYTKKYTISI